LVALVAACVCACRPGAGPAAPLLLGSRAAGGVGVVVGGDSVSAETTHIECSQETQCVAVMQSEWLVCWWEPVGRSLCAAHRCGLRPAATGSHASMQAAAAAAAVQSANRTQPLVGCTKEFLSRLHAGSTVWPVAEGAASLRGSSGCELGKPTVGLWSTLLHACMESICWRLEQQLQLTVRAVDEAGRRRTSPSRGVPAGSSNNNHRRHHVPQKMRVLC
jgi:hypothetical protein